MNQEITCCFTGPRPPRLPGGGKPDASETEALRKALRSAIKNAYRDGYRYFMSGMADGFDLLAAEAVLTEKKNGLDIFLIAVFPSHDSLHQHPTSVCRRIDAICASCDLTLFLQSAYSVGCERRRNLYMVDSSSRIIGYYTGLSRGTAHCWNYAIQKGLERINLYGNTD